MASRRGRGEENFAASHEEDLQKGDLVTQFQEITNCTDLAFASSFLEAHGWDLEGSVEAFLSGDAAPDVPPSTLGSGEDDVRAPIPAMRDTLLEAGAGFGGGLVSGFNPRTPRTIFDTLRDYQQEEVVQRRRDRDVETIIKRRPAAEQNKLRTLANLFRPPAELLFNGTFEQCKRQCTIKKKWLLVNIQDVQEFASSQLNRDTWSNPELRTLIQESFLMIQCTRESEEGGRYSLLYKVSTFPHVGLIDPRTGQLLQSWSGFVPAATLRDEIQAFVNRNSLDDLSAAPLPKLPAKQKPKVDLTEEEMLAEAIAASLRESTESAETESKKRKREIKIDSDDEDEEGSENGNEEDEDDEEEPKRIKTEERIEPQQDTPSEEQQLEDDESKGAPCTLQIRSMDGSAFSQTFREQDTLDKVRRWLVSNNKLGGAPPFALVTPFPRRTFSEEDDKATLHSLGLTPRAVLIIHPKS